MISYDIKLFSPWKEKMKKEGGLVVPSPEVLWHHPGKATSSVDVTRVQWPVGRFWQRLQRFKRCNPKKRLKIQECSELGSVNYTLW